MKRAEFSACVFTVALMAFNPAASLNAADLSGRAGAFADIGLGLRPLGMGGAYSALAADENGARWNPAMLAEVEDYLAGFSYVRQFNLIAYNYLAIAAPDVYKGIGAGAFVIDSGDEVYNETTIGLGFGVPLEEFGSPLALNAGAALKILSVDYGRDTEGGPDRVQGTASGFGVDLALQWRLSDEASAALVMRDLLNTLNWKREIEGSQPSSGSYTEGLTRAIVFGFAYTLDVAAFSAEYKPGLYADTNDRLTIGTEFTFWKAFKARIGMAQDMAGADRNRWVTFGMGLDLAMEFVGPIKQVKFGYSLLMHDIDSSPRVGLTLGW
ncbi:MAG: hypothetical protein FJY65_10065 [Calditrichaeota bacterium]|nr:hypothetical protein [Calditrichota bacterium]